VFRRSSAPSSWNVITTVGFSTRHLLSNNCPTHILELRHVLGIAYWAELMRLLLTVLVRCFCDHNNFTIMDKTPNLFINLISSTPELVQCNIIFNINTAIVKANILLLVPDALKVIWSIVSNLIHSTADPVVSTVRALTIFGVWNKRWRSLWYLEQKWRGLWYLEQKMAWPLIFGTKLAWPIDGAIMSFLCMNCRKSHTTSVRISGDLAVIQAKKLLSTRLEY
jgi:hypothetical protein